MQTTLPISGGCACGSIRYEIQAQPLFMFQCHCRDCQRSTGGLYAPNVWFPVPEIKLNLEPKTYEVVSDAGHQICHDFCENCGSPIGMRTSNYLGGRGFRAATLDNWDWLEPMANIYMKNSPKWEVTNPDLEIFDAQPPSEFVVQMIQSQS
jgi:hypothetical protein